MVPVIRVEEHGCVLRRSTLLERLEDRSHMLVHVGHARIIRMTLVLDHPVWDGVPRVVPARYNTYQDQST